MSEHAQLIVTLLVILLGAVALQLTDRLAPSPPIVVTVHIDAPR